MSARLPWLLVHFRLAAGPMMIALAAAGQGLACALVLSLGVLSDIFDGIIARRLGVATPALRTWDSRADVLFWGAAVVAVVVLRPQLVPVLWPAAAVIAALEIANHAVSFAKFRREASPHHWLSKAFGLGLWLVFGLAFATGRPGVVLWIVLGLGVASQIEAFAITLRLRQWRCDVPSVFSLRQARRAFAALQSAASRHGSGDQPAVFPAESVLISVMNPPEEPAAPYCPPGVRRPPGL